MNPLLGRTFWLDGVGVRVGVGVKIKVMITPWIEIKSVERGMAEN